MRERERENCSMFDRSVVSSRHRSRSCLSYFHDIVVRGRRRLRHFYWLRVLRKAVSLVVVTGIVVAPGKGEIRKNIYVKLVCYHFRQTSSGKISPLKRKLLKFIIVNVCFLYGCEVFPQLESPVGYFICCHKMANLNTLVNTLLNSKVGCNIAKP